MENNDKKYSKNFLQAILLILVVALIGVALALEGITLDWGNFTIGGDLIVFSIIIVICAILIDLIIIISKKLTKMDEEEASSEIEIKDVIVQDEVVTSEEDKKIC